MISQVSSTCVISCLLSPVAFHNTLQGLAHFIHTEVVQWDTLLLPKLCGKTHRVRGGGSFPGAGTLMSHHQPFPGTLPTSQCPSMCLRCHFHLLVLLPSLGKDSELLKTFPSLLLSTSQGNPVAFSLIPARCSCKLTPQVPQPGLPRGALSLPVPPRHSTLPRALCSHWETSA